ncbi:MAG: hypothetical protein MUE58_02700 [Chitinophagaceae bacterium]|jgi:hypothetical protein|nr:hypothetical protein [Chitinophagaceae bacterium]
MTTKRNATFSLFNLALLAVPTALIAFVVVVSSVRGIPVKNFFSDTNAIGDLPFYTGIVSNMGIILWFSSAVIAWFSARLAGNEVHRSQYLYLNYFGLLSLVLFLDDMLMIHEQVPGILPFVSEKKIYAAYLALVLYGMYRYRAVILKTPYSIAMMSLLFLLFSLVVDIFQERLEGEIGRYRIVLEDGFKFLGIVHWFGYCLASCHRMLSEKLTSGQQAN